MSTGLYIPGRQIIEVSLPEAAACADLKVRHAPSPRITQKPDAPAFIVASYSVLLHTLLAVLLSLSLSVVSDSLQPHGL